MSTQVNEVRVIPPPAAVAGPAPRPASGGAAERGAGRPVPAVRPREPLWRDLVGDVLRRERLDQGRTLRDVAEAARISMPYLSEVERGRKEASSEVLAAAARALGLGLGDLLARTQGELVRVTSTVSHRSGSAPGGPVAGRTAAPYGGLCLAA
ncbi:helix-turn-helix domain-containing protein [Streptomyces sp. NPDC090306]|uniref:helix-turn-helix domain-containing protein n=1 Tax=unclassified Streptomyces TaxID=2593676 RepID=UPI0036F022E9